MKKTTIKIDQEKCIGCGLCVNTCHQGALELIDGKATLVSEDHCDGLGRCLPHCPVDAIELIERSSASSSPTPAFSGCPGSDPKEIPSAWTSTASGCPGSTPKEIVNSPSQDVAFAPNNYPPVNLSSWPIQIQLVPVQAPYFKQADLLIAADCTAFAYANFHQDYLKDRICLIGCPKLDDTDYSEKLCEIFQQNDIRSVCVLRMEVPCCSGLTYAVETALKNSGKMIPWGYRIIALDGQLMEGTI